MRSRQSGTSALAASGIAAILASACCVGPLVLVTLGLGGAWIANLQMLEPYRPILLALALVSLFFAWRRIYRPPAECEPNTACALSQVKRGYRIVFWVVAALVLLALSFPYFARFFY